MVTAREHFDRLEEEAGAIACEAEALVAGLDERALFRQPSPGRWSVAHCLEHLAKTADLYLPQVREAVEGSRVVAHDGEGEEEYRPSWFGRWFVRASGPEVHRKFKAPRPFRPPDVPPPDAVERFVSRHRELRGLIAAARRVDPNRSRVKPPTIPLVTLSVAEALALLVGHERRHLEQAKRAASGRGA